MIANLSERDFRGSGGSASPATTWARAAVSWAGPPQAAAATRQTAHRRAVGGRPQRATPNPAAFGITRRKLDDGPSPSCGEMNHQQDDTDDKQNPRDLRRNGRHAGGAKHACDQTDDQKD